MREGQVSSSKIQYKTSVTVVSLSLSSSENFFGFINEDVAKKILHPNQWLVRCDDEGFVITLSRTVDATLVYESHRVNCDIADGEISYALNFDGEIEGSNWEPIGEIMQSVGLQRASSGAPLMQVCGNSLIYNWREGESSIIGEWVDLMKGYVWCRGWKVLNLSNIRATTPHWSNGDCLHCFRWYTNIAIIPDRKTYFNQALERVLFLEFRSFQLYSFT